MPRPLSLLFDASSAIPAGRSVQAFQSIVVAAMAGVSASAVAAHQSTGSAFDGMGAKALTAVRAITTLAAAHKTLTVAIIAYTAAAAAGFAELEKFEKLAEIAAASNVGTTFFQAFTVGADQFRLKVQELQSDLAALEKSTREKFSLDAVGGSTNAARGAIEGAFLGEAGPGSASVSMIQNAQSAEERIRAVLVALKDLEGQGRQLEAIDIARRLGLSNLAEQVDKGRASFAAFAAETDRLAGTGLRDGSLISPELISRADELKRRWEENGRELDRNMRPILEECARLALSIGNGAAWTAEQFTALIGVVGRLVARLRDGTIEATALAGAASRLPGATQRTPEPALDDGPAQSQKARDDAFLRQRRGTIGQVERLREDAGGEFDREARRARGLGGLEAKPAEADFRAPVPSPRPLDAPGVPRSSSSSSADDTDKRTEAVEKFIRNQEKANALLQAELVTVGKTTAERERGVEIAKAEAAAREHGGRLTDEEREKIGALAEAHGRLKDAIKDAEAQQKALADATQYLGDKIVDVAFRGGKLQDVLRGVAAELARAALTGQGFFAQLLGTAPSAGSPVGSVGGLLGALFGGGGGGGAGAGVLNVGGALLYDTGGWTGEGGKHEPAGIVHRGEYVFDQDATRRIGVPALEALRKGLPGYAEGGLVAGRLAANQRYAAGRAMGLVDQVAAGRGGGNTVGDINVSVDARGATRDDAEAIATRLKAEVLQEVVPHLQRENARGVEVDPYTRGM